MCEGGRGRLKERKHRPRRLRAAAQHQPLQKARAATLGGDERLQRRVLVSPPRWAPHPALHTL